MSRAVVYLRCCRAAYLVAAEGEEGAVEWRMHAANAFRSCLLDAERGVRGGREGGGDARTLWLWGGCSWHVHADTQYPRLL